MMLDETGQATLAYPDTGLAQAPDTGLAHDPATGHPRPPRREFKARGSFTERCPGCNLPVLNCLCPYRVSAGSEARVWLLTHPLEHLKPTNTGRLIGDVLPDTEVFTLLVNPLVSFNLPCLIRPAKY